MVKVVISTRVCSSMVEHQTLNLADASSSPARPTNFCLLARSLWYTLYKEKSNEKALCDLL